jgi:hypothetical protein
MNPLFKTLAKQCAGITVLTFSSLAAYYFVSSQFGGYDLSPLIDLSWRLSNGEVPGVDFINTMPIALIALLKLFSWGELAWTDLTSANIAIAIATYLFLICLPATQKHPWQWHLSIAMVISLPIVYTNHLWHSSLSQFLAVMFFYATYEVIKNQKTTTLNYIFVFIASGALVLAKQNVALPALFASVLFFLLNPKSTRILVVIVAGALIGLTLTTLLLGSSLDNFIYSYQAILGRGKPDWAMYNAFLHIISHWLLAPLAFLCFRLLYLSSKEILISERLYIYLFVLISLLPILTDWDTKINNLTLPLFIAITSVYNETKGFKNLSRQRTLLVTIVAIYLIAIIGGYSRERMKHVGPYYQKPLTTELSQGYFKGLKTGNTFKLLLSEIHQIKDNWPDKNIYFGPRIEFAYLETKTKSPKGMPLWFHPGTSYSLNDSQRVTDAFTSAKFDLLVFSKNDRTRIPVEILQIVNERYIRVGDYSAVDLYIKK